MIFQDFIEKNIGSGTFEKSHIGPLKEMLFTWKGIFGRFVPNENEQLYFISVLEDLCIEYPKFIDVFHVIIQLLNSDEFNLLPDEIIVKWAEKETSEYPTSEGYKEIHEVYHKSFKEKMKKFLDQLSLY